MFLLTFGVEQLYIDMYPRGHDFQIQLVKILNDAEMIITKNRHHVLHRH